MRRIILAASVAALAIALLPSARLTPAARAAAPAVAPKVVVIVGPVGSLTADYISWAQEAAAEARRYTPNVVRIYSPNATWARVKAALQGASVVIYLGHGNGWPSRYRTTPWPQSQNGLGLNPVAGANNTTTQYWGEYYLARDVRLAPNAVVLLHRLCYASGNSEPGLPPGTPAVAEQRVDNFAAGWLASGARLVIADGHSAPLYYVRSLFTRSVSLDRIWAASPSADGNTYSVASVRTPGAVTRMDPDDPLSGYYRSLAGWPSTSADLVVRTAYPSTATDPATFVVPGFATVAAVDAGVFPDPTLTPDAGTGLPPAMLALGTTVRVLEQAGLTPEDAPVLAVETLDGATGGYMSGAQLTPRDSAGPKAWWIRAGTGRLSPNDDGSGDTLTLVGRFSEPGTWRVRLRDAGGAVVGTIDGSGQDLAATWDGLTGAGAALPEGTYTYEVAATDALGNAGPTAGGSLVIDLAAPTATGGTPTILGGTPTILAGTPAILTATTAPAPVPLLTPNGDRVGEQLVIPYTTSEAGYVDLRVRNASGTTVRSMTRVAPAGSGSVTWDAGNYLGTRVPDGSYTASITVRDAAGNRGPTFATPVNVYGALAGTKASPTIFFPQDGDALAPSSRLEFTLRSAATVTMTIADASGKVVYTRYDARALAAGMYAFTWKGTDQAGKILPRGRYAVTVAATNGTLGTSQKASVLLDAFRISTSATAAVPARRGKTLTVTAVTAEPLRAAPRLRIAQPGLAAWAVTMTKVSSTTYRATITLRTGGLAGTLDLRVSGTDTKGGSNASAPYLLPLE